MPQYRKKPVVIEALQWTGENTDTVIAFIGDKATSYWGGGHAIMIETLEGTMRADRDDWIIKGVKGEFYSCKPDIFAITYDPV
jgi:hypothetical protein